LRRELHSRGITAVIYRRYQTEIVGFLERAIKEVFLEDAPGLKNVLKPDFLDMVDSEGIGEEAFNKDEIDGQPGQEATPVEHADTEPSTIELDDDALESALLRDVEDEQSGDALNKKVEELTKRFGKKMVLQQAVDAGATSQVIALLAQGADASNISLCEPASKGEGPIIVHLVRAGANCSTRHRDKIGRTALLAAIAHGHTVIARYLVKKGAPATDPSPRGMTTTILQSAVLTRDTALVLAILRAGIDLEAVDLDYSRTALHFACQQAQEKIIVHLLNAGANLEAVDKYNRSVLYCSCLNASLEIVEYLLDSGADLEQCDRRGRTPLCALLEDLSSSPVCHSLTLDEPDDKTDIFNPEETTLRVHFEERVRVVHLLLSRGADINKANAEKQTPLHFAVIMGREDLVDSLIAGGAKIDAPDRRGLTPLTYAILAAKSTSLETLLLHGAGPLQYHYFDMVLNSILPRTKRWTQNTEIPLHDVRATHTPRKPLPIFSKFKYNANSVKFLDLLLSRDPGNFDGHKIQARLHQRKEYRLHPLLFAAQVGYLELVACLVRHGISLETVCFSGMTPLHYAAEKGYKTVVKYLLAHGANIHTVNRCGETPLHLVANIKHPGCDDIRESIYSAAEKPDLVATVSVLAFAGVDINAISAEGDTALHIAARTGNQHVYLALVIFDADQDIKNSENRTVVELAEDAWAKDRFKLWRGWFVFPPDSRPKHRPSLLVRALCFDVDPEKSSYTPEKDAKFKEEGNSRKRSI
jgi:ankyrin